MKYYCIDCMSFLTKVVRQSTLPGTRFNTKKIRNVVNKRGRAVIFWCRITGAYYLNTHRVYKLEACEKHFDDASKVPEIKINIKIKGKGARA